MQQRLLRRLTARIGFAMYALRGLGRGGTDAAATRGRLRAAASTRTFRDRLRESDGRVPLLEEGLRLAV